MKKSIALILLILSTAAGCKKKPDPIVPPAKATLVSPMQNELCTNGRVVNSTESTVLFDWNDSQNTESYELSIKNLLTGIVIIKSTTQTQHEVTILRNTPYSWYTTSKSSRVAASAQSDVWKFYNSGPGEVSNAPFPADITAPSMAQSVAVTNGLITLYWTGSDVDGDIIGYDVYFGTTNAPTLLKSNITEGFLAAVSVEPNKTYFWKITTRDSKGNTSVSAVYQFKVL
ncbi:MAG: hypothetical protein H7Y07_00180 [Pyrinomonadaceae bacterium]|nr:hypothetical protein [Sphingobacteriaceae bacterium]